MPKPILDDIIISKKSPFSFKTSAGGHGHHGEKGRSHLRTYLLAASAAGLLILLFFSLSIFFSGATVTVYPKKSVASVDRNVPAGTEGSVPLKFKIIQVSKTESTEANATGQKEASKKASGTIIVYNAYSANSQRLIKNTRFETPDGKIYRINSSIVVPGMTVSDGKNIPGSVEAVVYADEAGEKYNIGRTDFTIPGFKGDPRYQKFYARSKTDMQGGMKGFVYTISDEDARDITALLEKRLNESLIKEALKETPPEYILFDSASFFDFSDIRITNASGNEKRVNVEKTGTLHIPAWERASLAKYIAQVSIDGYTGDPVTSHNLESISIGIKDLSILSSSKLTTMNVSLKGTTTIVWLFDEDALIKDLAGKPKQDFQAILRKYPGIDRAELVVTPPWARTISDGSGDISIKIIIK